MKAFHSIRLRLAALSAGAIAVLGGVIALGAEVRLRAELERDDMGFAEHEAIELSQVIARAASPAECRQRVLSSEAHIWPEEGVEHLEVQDLAGNRVVVLPVDAPPVAWPAGVVAARSRPYVEESVGWDGRPRFRACRVVTVEGEPRWVAIAKIDRSKSFEALAGFHRALLVGIPLATLTGFLASFGLISLALRPLSQVVADARRIAVEGPGQRLAEPGRESELGELVRLLNVMLVRIDENVTQLRRFAADASHELRTPLARMRGEAEVALRAGDPESAQQALASVVEEVEGLSRLVAGLLELARGDAAPAGDASFDLAPLVSGLAEEARLLGEAQGTGVELRTAPEGAWVRGTRDLIASAVWNLLKNALLHGGSGARVEVRVSRDAGRARVEVADHGPGVPPEQAPRLFQAFARGDASRATEGHGLGLALSRTIARRHGGELRHEPTQGGGATFVLELPLATAPP